MTWLLKIEDSDCEQPENRRVIDGHSYGVAKFMTHRVNQVFFDENFKAFSDLQSSNSKESKSKFQSPLQDKSTKFKQDDQTVRDCAYKKLNNCTSFPQESFAEANQNMVQNFKDMKIAFSIFKKSH
jgi:hypothetical protein